MRTITLIATILLAAFHRGALRLGGAAGRVEIPGSTDLRLAGDMTVALWVKRTPDGEGSFGLVRKGGERRKSYGLSITSAREGGRILFEQWDAGGAATTHVQGQTPLETGVWHQVACWVEKDEVRVYLDGCSDGKGRRESVVAPSGYLVTLGASEGSGGAGTHTAAITWTVSECN